MSKKDKSKFRKRLRAQILKDIQNSPVARTPLNTTSSVSIPKTESLNVPHQDSTIPLTHGQVLPSNDALSWVKKDLKKSALIIGSIIIIIVGLYFLDSKYNILIDAGNNIFKVLNITG